jgi:hypothetical protein
VNVARRLQQLGFDLKPQYLAADTAYGSAETLNWIVNEKRIAPHIPLDAAWDFAALRADIDVARLVECEVIPAKCA